MDDRRHRSDPGGECADADRLHPTLDGGRPTALAATQSVTLADVPAGVHSIELSGVPPWCIAGSGGFPGANPVQVSVAGGSVSTVTFGVLCLG